MVRDFETLFIDKYFTRAKTEVNDCDSELFYFEGKMERMMNLDESEVSVDVTTKSSGRRPLTKLSLADSSLPKGATVSNKSEYSVTFIGGSTVAG